MYIHIVHQYKRSEDLEIYELDYSSNTHLQEVCDIKQPILFEYKTVIPEFYEKMNYEDLSPSGSLYKVDLPDTHVRRMLDWDAPLKDQPYNVRSFAKKMGMDMTDLGGDLVMKVGKSEEGKRMMQEAGIPGIKYFDQVSRGDQKNARNFVVFDPNHLTILERNAKPIK